MTPKKKDAYPKADQDKTVKPSTAAAKKAESAAKEGRATEERESERPKKGASMPKDTTKHAAPSANKSNEPNMASDKKPGTNPKTGKQPSQGGNQSNRGGTNPPQKGQANTTAPQPGTRRQGAETTEMDNDSTAQTDDQRSVDNTQGGSRGSDKDPYTGATRHPANSGSDDRADHGNVDPYMTDEDEMDRQGPVNKSGELATNPTDRKA